MGQTRKIPAEAVDLYTRFIHGEINRRDFLDGVERFAIAGLTADEAAKALGVSRNTLKARLWRARHQLASRLNGFLGGRTQTSRRTHPLAADLAHATTVAGD